MPDARGFRIPYLALFGLAAALSAGSVIRAWAAPADGRPVAVSPGDASKLALIEGRCPTFSWGEVPDAELYELVVYRLAREGEEAQPVLRETVSGSASSWTPSLDRCLVRGGQYAWSVRVASNRVASAWSPPSLFEVASGATEAEFEEALQVVRQYLARGSDTGTEGADGSGSSAETRLGALTEVPELLSAPAATQLSVDGNVDAVSFTGDGENLAGVATDAELTVHSGDATAHHPAISSGFDALTTGMNTSASMTVGSGASLAASGTGTIAATTATTATTATSAATATALAADGTDCAADEAAGGVDAAGNAEACRDQADLTAFGTNNTRVGTAALAANTTGDANTAVGDQALTSNTTGHSNTAFGALALNRNTIGATNVGVGRYALAENAEGGGNTAVGEFALRYTTVSGNTAVGASALYATSTGTYNTAVGFLAAQENDTGSDNTAIGRGALRFNTSGSSNVALGRLAGYSATTGSNNIFIANEGAAGDAAKIKIGAQGTQTATYVAGIFGTTTGVMDAVTVMVDSAGQLGTVNSSRRYKEDIHDMAEVSERLLAMRPVTFRYKKEFADGGKPIQFGLIAEEVAQVFPEVVVYDEEGRPETVKYHLLSSLLLNELQKVDSLNQEQEAKLAALPDLESQVTELAKLRAEVRELRAVTARLIRLEAMLIETSRLTAEARREPPEERPGSR